MDQSTLVSIGLRPKTGRAIAVVLGGSIEAPVVLLKTEIKLVDPKVPATAQPYHEVMDLPWEQSQRAVRKYAAAIERTAQKALAKLIEEQASNRRKVVGAGIVGAPDRDLARIALMAHPLVRDYRLADDLLEPLLGAESRPPAASTEVSR